MWFIDSVISQNRFCIDGSVGNGDFRLISHPFNSETCFCNSFKASSIWLFLVHRKIERVRHLILPSAVVSQTELSCVSSIPVFYVSKEIIQSSDINTHSVAAMEAHLQRALLRPTGKIDGTTVLSEGFGPLWRLVRWYFLPSSGRFLEDYAFHKTLKVLRALEVVGFSLNPEHCRGSILPVCSVSPLNS